MTQKEAQLILEMFDQLTDVLNGSMKICWEESYLWDSFNRAMRSVISARAELAKTFNRLPVKRN